MDAPYSDRDEEDVTLDQILREGLETSTTASELREKKLQQRLRFQAGLMDDADDQD